MMMMTMKMMYLDILLCKYSSLGIRQKSHLKQVQLSVKQVYNNDLFKYVMIDKCIDC